VLYRTRRRDDAPLLDELRELADVRGHRLVVSYSREPGEEDPHPFAPDRLLERFPDLGERDVFLCGPPGVIAGALDGLHAAGVPAGRIHRERFVY
jgi:ferredoxin-NADP reductase